MPLMPAHSKHTPCTVLVLLLAHEHLVLMVLTPLSSAAVHGDNNIQPPKNGSLYTADDWNTTSTPEEEPYFVSKVESLSAM
jgi:hypothetical protein